MNGRNLPQCLNSYKNLDIDVILCTAYTEKQLEWVIPRIVENTSYDNYIVTSDDVIANRKAHDAVLDMLDAYELTTGYVRITPYTMYLNVVKKPLRGEPPAVVDYAWYTLKEVPYERAIMRTWFLGMAWTALRRELWLRFPFGAYNGGTFDGIMSDYHLSYRLQNAGFEMYFDTQAKFVHLSHHKDYLMGTMQPQVTINHTNGESTRMHYIESTVPEYVLNRGVRHDK